ncbi:MAG: fructosamine kinase family protein [Bacteroidales bacterium]
MLTEKLLNHLSAKLSGKLTTATTIRSFRPVSGGDINQAYRLESNNGTFFIKVNNASRYPAMFETEARGLELLGKAGELTVPEVILHGALDDTAYLMLNFIHQSTQMHGFWDAFGNGLARLHKHSWNGFGLDHDNYIGSLPQSNTPQQSWAGFYSEERLRPQINMAQKNGFIDTFTVNQFEALFTQLENIFPEEPPSLVHGDLWGGNYMCGPQGEPVIIDPAVYYGHREMDLGMTRLFGGFHDRFYRSYNEQYPLSPGWEERLDICNLYPLMVHVNLFGPGYAGSVKSILSRF